MFYHLFFPLHESYSIFNVFRYITFRSSYAVVTALVLSFIMGPWLIRYLIRKNLGEKVNGEYLGHHAPKTGTPTMGGILIIVSLIVPTLLWADLTNGFVWACLMTVVLFGGIGLYDDIVKQKNHVGIGMRLKLFLQVAACIPILIFLSEIPGYDGGFTSVQFPFFKNLRPDFSYFYYVFAVIVITGASNAVNLTDGLDGLAIGPIIIAFGAYTVISYVVGHAGFAGYLQIAFIRGMGEVTILCGAVVGASLGFLWFNSYPAQIFMGNVGSISMGALLGVVALITKHEIILVLIGGIFVTEAISVIIQVGYYKMTKKRFFLMAPLHHHFEKKGWAEPKVITRFWIVAILLALISLSTLKLR
ncbi:MAG: phospho-N-acetylmuramoyl-pentapeptide-transferase [Nitrospinota bacterium]